MTISVPMNAPDRRITLIGLFDEISTISCCLKALEAIEDLLDHMVDNGASSKLTMEGMSWLIRAVRQSTNEQVGVALRNLSTLQAQDTAHQAPHSCSDHARQPVGEGRSVQRRTKARGGARTKAGA